MNISKTKTYNLLPLAEVKEHLKIHPSDSSYDSELQRLSRAAILETEKRIGGDIVPTTNTLTDYCVTCSYYRIDEPNINVSSISATTNGVTTAISGYQVYKFSSYSVIKFDSGVQAETLVIEYTSGFSFIPEDLKSAVLIKIGMHFDVEKSGYINNNMKESKAYQRIISSYTNLV